METEAYTEKVEAGRLTKGDYVMMGDKPSKVVKTSKAKPGKHGSAKIILTASSVITGKNSEISHHTADMVDAPIIKKTEYPLLGIDGDFLQLLDETNEQKDDVKMLENDVFKDVNKEIRKFEEAGTPCLVTVMKVCGEEIPCSVREDKEGD